MKKGEYFSSLLHIKVKRSQFAPLFISRYTCPFRYIGSFDIVSWYSNIRPNNCPTLSKRYFHVFRFELFPLTCIAISQLSESPLTTFPVVESPDEIFSYQAWSIIKRQRNFLFITCVLKVALERPAKVAAAQAKMAKA